jgi:biopolymer transport protein ExbD
MKFSRNARVFRGQLDLTPVANVLFLLLLFILLNSGMVFTPGVRIELPVAGPETLPGTDRPTVVVAVDQGGQLFFNQQIIPLDQLGAQLTRMARSQSNLTLVIQSDKRVSYDTVVQLGQLARQAGMQEVLFALRPLPVEAQ